MAMLDRYRKTGGFNQLLNLLETCGPVKQEKFLELIRAEDPRWAKAILAKMLNMNRIYSWGNDTLSEIVGGLQDLTVAIVLHGASDENRERILSFYTHLSRRKIESLYEEQKPTAAEISTAYIKVIESIRRMVQNGALRFEKFDVNLMVEDDIEDRIARETGPEPFNLSAHVKGRPEEAPIPDKPVLTIVPSNGEIQKPSTSVELRAEEINALKQRIGDLSKENAALRQELSLFRSKFGQIKKIA